MNSTATLEIAKTIASQIGNKALFMIGAKNLVAIENGLQFKIGKNSKGVNYVQITLNGLDLYDVRFLYVTINGITEKAKTENAYDDMLCSLIEKETGLYTHL